MTKTLIALLLGASLACGAGRLSPKAQRAADTFDCYVAVLTPYVGDALDTAQLVEDAVQGRANIGTALHLLGNTRQDVEFVAMALEACRSLPELAPPPAELAAF